MSNLEIQVIDAQTEDNLTGIIIDGVPHLYWLRVYQALGLKKEHGPKIIARLTEGIHYRKFTNSEFVEQFPTVAKTATVYIGAKSFVFLTAEGYHRAIMEISTGHMNNPEVAAAIDAKKDEMASIYTRYQQGEVLSKADEHPALTGEVQSDYAPVAVVLEDQMAIAKVMVGIGVEPAIANAMAFSVTEEITHCGDTLTPWKNLIQTDPLMQEPGTLTPTDIGKALGGMSAIEVNQTLVKLGYQIKVGKEWTPTYSGKLYARYVPQEIKHHSGIKRHMQLKWLPSIVEKLRSSLYYQQRGQTGLFVGEIAG